MRILNLGSLNVDYVYQVGHIVRPGETIPGRSLQIFPGGKGANQSNAIAKAGGNVWHAGKVGADGRWLIDVLADAGVHTELIHVHEGRTGHAVIQVDPAGENSIVLFGGGNHAVTKEDIDLFLRTFTEGDYLVLQNEISNVPYAIEAAKDKGMRICFNPAPFSREINNWPLDDVAILILNVTEASGLAGADGPAAELLPKLTAAYPRTEVVITAGAEGSFYGCGSESSFCPARSVSVVDTTAAGDTFLGYYLAARSADIGPEDALKRATAAAAITVSRPGAMSSIPDLQSLSLPF